ncbi:S-adenosyl-L-methionine-dependent methyltransferase [Hyaloscypha bicolor E]|uniref:S-adenosyl-L-methionine-dependent methyltransferase n=1 Tax=Hyaloscypha bicolor E TaxID=1095630 RepID=A0A2J6T788_9HELO|nr:S-adenosyl-L-methionine-dependent methyltransferase [Hyaloscypha bicolor E]PMD58868.1 S-adenosyl-L-methionine-dependent methyltransferase [Hyaloscypha bicolor E]
MSDTGYETDSVRSYNFPNNDPEQDREDVAHALIASFCYRLHFASIGRNPQNILDMGTGTGIWAIGSVDLSPIQPLWVPPNSMALPPNHFDYIHSRHMVMAIRDWPKLMRRALNHLKPGGWMETQEIHHRPCCRNGSMPPDHPVAQYWGLVSDGLAGLGIDSDATLLLADMLRDAGFINVTTRIFDVPIGRAILLDGAQPIALGPMTRGLKWSREQVEMRLVEVRRAYMDEWVHSYMPLYIICGQKPEEGMSLGI